MMKNTTNYKSRFKILKGGKIALIISTLLLSGVVANATDFEINEENHSGVSVDNNDTVTITKNGSITSTGNGIQGAGSVDTNVVSGHFVYTANPLENITINNNNKITVTTDKTAKGIDLKEIINSNITNTGTININSTNEGASGISLTTNDQSHIFNKNNTIINSGNIIVEGTSARGVHIVGDDSTLKNSGIISVTSTSSFATGMKSQLGDNVTLENSGTITSSSSENDAYGIHIQDDTNSTISNSGTITINNANEGYAIGIYNENSDNTIVNNSGTITALNSSKAYSLKGNANDNVTVTNEQKGVLKGTIKLYDSSSLTNYGTIFLPSYSISQIPTFTNKAGGILSISLDKTASGYSYGTLKTGTATFEDGSTLNVDVTTTSTDVSLLVGEVLGGVVSSDTNLIIDGTLNVTDNSALLDFAYIKDDNTLDLNITQASTISDATTNGDGTTKRLSNVLDEIQEDGKLTNLMEKLNALQTNADVTKAIKSLAPDVNNAASQASSKIIAGIQGIIAMRQNVGLSGLNSGEQIFSDNKLWMKPYGSFGKQKDVDGTNGFDLDAYGLGIGTDGEYAPNQKLGLAFFYTNADVDTNNEDQDASLDVYTLLGYGSLPVIDDKTTFLYQASYSWQKTDTSRVALGDTINGDYTSKTASLDLKLLRDYQINSSWLLQPLVEFTYRNFSSPSYTETSSGVGALSIQSSSTTQAIAGLGLLSAYKINDNSKIISSVNVGYDLKDDAQSATSSFVGASGYDFTTEGIDNGRYSYDVGVGYEIDLNKNSNLNFTYNLQGEGSEFTNNSFSAKYLYKF